MSGGIQKKRENRIGDQYLDLICTICVPCWFWAPYKLPVSIEPRKAPHAVGEAVPIKALFSGNELGDKLNTKGTDLVAVADPSNRVKIELVSLFPPRLPTLVFPSESLLIRQPSIYLSSGGGDSSKFIARRLELKADISDFHE